MAPPGVLPPQPFSPPVLPQVLGWLAKALQLLSLLLQHGGQMEAFLDDGGVMSLCLHLAKYPAIHAQLPPRQGSAGSAPARCPWAGSAAPLAGALPSCCAAQHWPRACNRHAPPRQACLL